MAILELEELMVELDILQVEEIKDRSKLLFFIQNPSINCL